MRAFARYLTDLRHFTYLRRRWLPNVHVRRFWVPSENRWVKLKVSSRGLRIIDKVGIDKVVADIRSRGEKI
ncbi:MAG: bL28 family ribosomal protein [Myxococcota bacterium]